MIEHSTGNRKVLGSIPSGVVAFLFSQKKLFKYISPDYFLWGFVKECVMAIEPTTPDGKKERIRQACTEITPQMSAEVRRSFHQRINKCLQVEGHHFEHLL